MRRNPKAEVGCVSGDNQAPSVLRSKKSASIGRLALFLMAESQQAARSRLCYITAAVFVGGTLLTSCCISEVASFAASWPHGDVFSVSSVSAALMTENLSTVRPSAPIAADTFNVTMLESGQALAHDPCGMSIEGILASHRSASSTSARGLYAVAAGSAATGLVDSTASHFLQFDEFDVVLLAYDETNWLDLSQFPWAGLGEPRVKVIRDLRQQKYPMAKRHLPAARLSEQGYSHLFLWDDDMELEPGFNARDVLLTLQLASRIKVAAPFVTNGCHLACWVSEEEALARDRSPEARLNASGHKWPHFLVETPEMMVPIYSVDAWGCYADLVDPELPESWGIDSPAAGCLCDQAGATLQGPGQAMLLHSRVAHHNLQTLSGAMQVPRARAFETKLINALIAKPGGKECGAVAGPLRQDGNVADLARTACLVRVLQPSTGGAQGGG